MAKDSKNLIVGLDIGTSKIVAIVAEVTPEAELNVIGLGTQPSRGLKRGVVVNIEATMASIQRVLEEAELMADCRISEVYTGVAGSHIRSLNSSVTGPSAPSAFTRQPPRGDKRSSARSSDSACNAGPHSR